jgi:hypothetical protein
LNDSFGCEDCHLNGFEGANGNAAEFKWNVKQYVFAVVVAFNHVISM